MLALSPPSALLARYRTWSASRRVVLSAGRTDLSFLGENSLHQIHVANLSYRCVRCYLRSVEGSCGDGLCTEECCAITSRALLRMGPGTCVLVHGVCRRLRNLSPDERDLKRELV